MNDTLKDKSTSLLRIGLALSGGGFRASIFHLGVIRRLEELGIMKYVHVISAVSGGSIIAAYYVIEMEKRMRRRRAELGENLERLDEVRLQIFEEIADCFFQALAVRGGSTFSELRWYPPVEAAKGSLSWVFRAKQPESVRTGP